MKKILIAFAVVAMSTLSANALTLGEPLAKGTLIAGAALGYQPGLGVALSGDYVLVDSWGKGHFSAGLSLNTTGPIKNFSVLPRVTYGMFLTEQIEAYAGLQIGYGYNKNTQGSVAGGLLLGGRYFFNDSMAAGLQFNLAHGTKGNKMLNVGYVPLVSASYTYLLSL